MGERQALARAFYCRSRDVGLCTGVAWVSDTRGRHARIDGCALFAGLIGAIQSFRPGWCRAERVAGLRFRRRGSRQDMNWDGGQSRKREDRLAHDHDGPLSGGLISAVDVTLFMYGALFP